jgi:hypothetical protein
MFLGLVVHACYISISVVMFLGLVVPWVGHVIMVIGLVMFVDLVMCLGFVLPWFVHVLGHVS